MLTRQGIDWPEHRILVPRDLFVVALVWLTDDVIVKEASAFPAHALPRSGVEDGRVNQISKVSFLCVPQIPPLADLVFILNQREIHLVCIALFQGTPLCKSSLHEFCGKVSSQNHPAVVVEEIQGFWVIRVECGSVDFFLHWRPSRL